MILKIERFSHLSGRSFGLGSPIGFGYLSSQFEISIDMTDISRIYRMSAKVDTIYPIDNSFNRNFGHFS